MINISQLIDELFLLKTDRVAAQVPIAELVLAGEEKLK